MELKGNGAKNVLFQTRPSSEDFHTIIAFHGVIRQLPQPILESLYLREGPILLQNPSDNTKQAACKYKTRRLFN